MNKATIKAIAELDKQPGQSGVMMIPNHSRPTRDDMPAIRDALYARGYLVVNVTWRRRDCWSAMVRRVNGRNV